MSSIRTKIFLNLIRSTLSLCIMCVQYRGGYHDKCGDILSTTGVFSTVEDIMSTVGGYLEYHGGCSVPWGYHDACGGYHEYRGGKSFVI